MANHVCDVPGCGGSRLRRQRLCNRCFARLPGELRVGIIEAKRQRRLADWNALRKRAAAFFNLDREAPPPSPSISPQRAYEMQARLLGERPE